jgi:2-amino-4-hydroxy-6-hydroxymethyldihydropteridine diphosphokinase
VIKQDILENPVNSIYLGIGSNLGNKKKNINKAKFELIQNNIKIIQSSNFYETLSWPNQNNPKFLNVILKIFTKLSPSELLKLCKEIEKSLGRKKTAKNSPRECDIDIIDYKNKKITGQITLPHPRMHKRNFVLFPLYELNKAWTHPISKNNIKTLISSLPIKDIRSIKQI